MKGLDTISLKALSSLKISRICHMLTLAHYAGFMPKSSHSDYKIKVCRQLNVHLFRQPEGTHNGRSVASSLKNNIHISLTISQLKEENIKDRKRQS